MLNLVHAGQLNRVHVGQLNLVLAGQLNLVLAGQFNLVQLNLVHVGQFTLVLAGQLTLFTLASSTLFMVALCLFVVGSNLTITFLFLGQYLFIESSFPRRPGDVAQIQSEQFDGTSTKGRCLTFWYHMNGADIGNLTVYLNNSNTRTLTPLWRLSGSQGNQWYNGKLPIKSTTKYYVSSKAFVRSQTVLKND